MDELEYKLKSQNVIVIAQTISKLVNAIKTKIVQNGMRRDTAQTEILVIREKCSDEKLLISLTACQAIIYLVDEGLLDSNEELSYFMSALSTASNFDGITQGVVSLFTHDVLTQIDMHGSYECRFNLLLPQHPFITILRQNKQIWENMFNQMQALISHQDDRIQKNSIKLLKPLIYYVLCNPTKDLTDDVKSNLWKLLITLPDRDDVTELILEILPSFQVSDLQIKSLFYKNLLEIAHIHNNEQTYDAVLPQLLEIVRQLIVTGHDPRPYFIAIEHVLNDGNTIDSADIILFILAEIVIVCPAIYLGQLVEICSTLVNNYETHALSKNALICSLLQWLCHPSCLIASTLNVIDDLIEKLTKAGSLTSKKPVNFENLITKNRWFIILKNSDENLFVYVKFRLFGDDFSDMEKCKKWLKKLTRSDDLPRFFLFLCALFINTSDVESGDVIALTLELLLKIIEYDSSLSTRLLTVLLHRLSLENLSAESNLQILRAIPKMAVLKENIALIVFTLEQLRVSKSAQLELACIELYTSLWKTETRCYPYLQKVLLEPVDKYGKEYALQFEAVKALALREICVLRPHQYGTEVVAHLSKILNNTLTSSSVFTTTIALNSIALLCKEQVVDIESTWKALAPRLITDKRDRVLISLCNLLSLVPELLTSNANNEKFIEEVIGKLWQFASENESDAVKKGALEALKTFDVEKMPMKLLPDAFTVTYKLNKRLDQLVSDETHETGDTLGEELMYIPGDCWVDMLHTSSSSVMEKTGDLIIHWAANEIQQYRSGVYDMHNPAKGEPTSFSYLPERSIVKAIGNKIKTQINLKSYHENVPALEQSLRILSHEYSKPLPPFCWNFLIDAFHINKTCKKYAFKLAAKQTIVSGSALRIVDNYLIDFNNSSKDDDEISIVLENLPHLCKKIPHNVIKGFIQKASRCAVVKYHDDGDGSLFDSLMMQFKSALDDEKIDSGNRSVIADELESLFDRIPLDTELFNSYCNCLPKAPTKTIEQLTTPIWWEITEKKSRKIIELRTRLSLMTHGSKPLNWFNECINAAIHRRNEQFDVLNRLLTAVIAHRHQSHAILWYQELMGRVQFILAGYEELDGNGIEFVSNTFMVVTIVMARFDCFLDGNDLLFSLRSCGLMSVAVGRLVELNGWRDICGQITEFVYHMSTNEKVATRHRKAYRDCLLRLKGQAHFKHGTNWMKYFSSTIRQLD